MTILLSPGIVSLNLTVLFHTASFWFAGGVTRRGWVVIAGKFTSPVPREDDINNGY